MGKKPFLKKKSKKPLRLTSPRVGCPFCWEWLPAAALQLRVFSGEGCRGGRCPCGAAFVMDDTGRSGGQALLDALALLCDGNLDRAPGLQENVDYELRTRTCQQSRSRQAEQVRGHSYLPPRVWAVRWK